MITRDRPTGTVGEGGNPPPPPERPREWWREWPAPFNRPMPINRRNIWRGGLVAVPFLVLADGFLATMAWYATGSVGVGLAVFGVIFLFTLGEIALVAWVAKKRQDLERNRAARG